MKICEQDKKHTFASYDPKERICEISGERDLWREVLFVAIEISKMDIDATLKRYKNEDNKRWERVILPNIRLREHAGNYDLDALTYEEEPTEESGDKEVEAG